MNNATPIVPLDTSHNVEKNTIGNNNIELFTPLDNSHYIEGISRYIWMPDGDDVLHIVDLQAPVEPDFVPQRSGSNNQYWLFTR